MLHGPADDREISFHLIGRSQGGTSSKRERPSFSSSSSSSISSSSSSSDSDQREPPSTKQEEPKLEKETKPKLKRTRKNAATNQAAVDPVCVKSVEPLKWADRICSQAYKNGAQCAYSRIDVFTEFSGTTCPESAAESIVNHMVDKPDLHFAYNADIKPSCRRVAMATRAGLGCQQTSTIT